MNIVNTIDSLNVVDLLLDAVCVVQADSTIVFVSPAFERIFGYTPQEAVGLRMLDLVHPDDLDATRREAQSIMQGSFQLEFENRYVRKDGRIAHIRWTARRATHSELRVAVAHDITERKRSEARQAAVYAISEAANATDDLGALFARVHSIIGELLDAQDLSVVLHDPRSNRLSYPYPPSSSPQILRTLDEDPRCARVLNSCQTVLEETASEPPDASGHYWLGVPLIGAQSTVGVLVLEGVQHASRSTQGDTALLQFVSTQIARAIETTQLRTRLVHMAQFDPLTDLPNRQLLLDRLTGALARAQRSQTRLSLMFLDLDRFKEVNDTFGHAIGDLLLQQVAQRLKACLRSTDTVARIGGDEFVLLLEDGLACATSAEALQVKIDKAFSEPFLLGAHSVKMQASVGTALFPDHGRDKDALLRYADDAMYARKQAGPGSAI